MITSSLRYYLLRSPKHCCCPLLRVVHRDINVSLARKPSACCCEYRNRLAMDIVVVSRSLGVAVSSQQQESATLTILVFFPIAAERPHRIPHPKFPRQQVQSCEFDHDEMRCPQACLHQPTRSNLNTARLPSGSSSQCQQSSYTHPPAVPHALRKFFSIWDSDAGTS
jgi:hypothetical protein